MVRRENSSRRHRPSRDPRTRLLVVCGAVRTEPKYLAGLCRAVRNAATVVKVITCPRDPLSVVKYTIKRRDQARDDYDQVWCVLDVDDFDFAGALALAERERIRLAISNPCFEVWLLLHHVHVGTGFADARAVLEQLKEIVPGYDKTSLRFEDFAAGTADAVARARKLTDTETVKGPNPSTGMWRLVELITEPGSSPRP